MEASLCCRPVGPAAGNFAPDLPRSSRGQKEASARFGGSSSLSCEWKGIPVLSRSSNQREAQWVASKSRRNFGVCCSASQDPLLVRAAKGLAVERPPAWMMRQAGRYMLAYRELAEKYPSFRERSETAELIVRISLQPWEAFQPDGVILFSDILTPLPAFGIPFEIDETRGPLIEAPIRSTEAMSKLHQIDLSQLEFVSDSLRCLRSEVGDGAAILGFIGAPWTLATYCVEGRSTRTYTVIKSMVHKAPQLLHALLRHLADQLAKYALFQIDSGAQCVQIFDSWGGQLPPDDWDRWSRPYIDQIVEAVRVARPDVPVVLYVNGSGGLLERMGATSAHVIGLDWTIDMADARARLGADKAVQGNVDPAVLFASPEAIEDAVQRVVSKAGPKGHILNLGHGVLVGTPEDSVARFFNVARSIKYVSQEAPAIPEPALS